MQDKVSAHYLAKIGERRYCFIRLWESEEKLIAARPDMIEQLNSVHELLQELSPKLGITDAISGPVIVQSIYIRSPTTTKYSLTNATSIKGNKLKAL